MIACPNCLHKELEGTLFCTECGAQLLVVDKMATQALKRVSTHSLSNPHFHHSTGPVSILGAREPVITLHLLDSGEVIRLDGKNEYFLGRVAEGSSNHPDVDLSPYEAYGQGVSRLHANLKIENQRVTITDLASSNGTRVNGQKISPNVEFPLNHGDLIALGKLKMQFLIQK